jgi:prophage regulatory protein
MSNTENKSKRLIRIKEVMQITGISKSYVYSLCSQNQFPQSVQLVKSGSAVAWVEQEVLNWIDSRIQARDSEVA